MPVSLPSIIGYVAAIAGGYGIGIGVAWTGASPSQRDIHGDIVHIATDRNNQDPIMPMSLSAARQLAVVEVEADKVSSATGGRVFRMDKIRAYQGQRLDSQRREQFPRPDESETCERWAVVTSIFEPTDTVRQLAAASDWCVVVVGDKNGPEVYELEGVTYLTPSDQEELPYRIIRLLPWNHFGRKNVGYLYAVHHGAKVIYDVDDDNALISPEQGVPHANSSSPPTTTFAFGGSQAAVHNPYGCFGGPANVWPRGFPLDAINNPDCSGCESSPVGALDDVPGGEPRPLGVVQALANHDPDVDAVYRLTFPPGGLPFDFEGRPTRELEEGGLKVIPPAAFTPYNAQATLHFPPAFWGMLLPVTVHGRVSDIWRSYFTQALLPSTGAVVAFAPPWVQQFRNPHNYLADFQAELPLYERSGALVAFLESYRREAEAASESGVDLSRMIEDLAVTMFEHGILGNLDVKLTQAWLMDLSSLGYEATYASS